MKTLAAIVLALLIAASASAQTGGSGNTTQQQNPRPIPPIRINVTGANTTLPTCGSLACYYVLNMEASSTIALPCTLDGQATTIKAFQHSPGGFTPTFAACPGYQILWANGVPVPAVLTSGKGQMYEFITDISSQGTPSYNEMRPGPE
jgi:hypothetical protein